MKLRDYAALYRLWKLFVGRGTFGRILGVSRFIDSNVFTTKAGALGMAFAVDGIDYESLTDDQLETYTNRIGAAWRGFNEGFRIYQYVVKQGATVDMSGEYPTAAVARTVASRMMHLAESGMYRVRIVYVVLFEPPAQQTKGVKARDIARLMARDQERYRTFLRARAESFSRQIGDLLGLRLMDKNEVFAFLRLLVNLDPEIASTERLKYDRLVDWFLPSVPYVCEGDALRIGRETVEVLTMREQPRQTFPHVLRDLLKIRSDFIICSEFKRVSTERALKVSRDAQRHHYVGQFMSNLADLIILAMNRGKKESVRPDKSAQNDANEIDSVITRINNDGEYLGEFSLTMALYGARDHGTLQSSVADVMRIFGDHEGSVVAETYIALFAYVGMIPGGAAFNVRRSWLLSGNYSDLALAYAPNAGRKMNDHLKKECLVILETEDNTPYCYNLHDGDRFGKLILGAPRSGKSVLANLLIDHSQKYSPRTLIIDVGGSYRETTKKHGGSYVHMKFGKDQSFRINPLSLPESDESIQFLLRLLSILIEKSGGTISGVNELSAFKSIRAGYRLPGHLRRLGNLSLPESLRPFMQQWIRGGRFGTIFDNAEDTLTFADFQTYDFEGMDETYEPVMEPIMFYTLHRFDAVVHDPKIATVPKQLWADEAWKFVTNQRCSDYFKNAGLTWPKHNGGIGLITQAIESLSDAGVLSIINQLCPVKLLLPNPQADLVALKSIFKLSDREAEMYAGMTPKRQFLMKTAEECRVLNVSLDKRAFWEYANSPNENEQRRAMVEKLGHDEALRLLAAK